MHWDGEKLSFTPGVTRASAPGDDEIEPLWLAYYGSIFNPARLKPKAMQAQLLKRNWKNLPEAAIIEPLLREAPRRTEFMLRKSEARLEGAEDHSLAAPPGTDSHSDLKLAASHCRACPLWRHATCTVFGEGPANARVLLVGEQPGDQEDRAGKPFVGPAGQVLASALAAAGLNRDEFYVTNAVKHFKWAPRGKRRLHQTPNSRDIASCRPWLAAEIKMIRPELMVCLGATALHAVFEIAMPVGANRGQFLETPFAIQALVTVHPSSLLRRPDEAQRRIDFERFVEDLKKIRTFASGPQ
jgi:DNA polymerase